jgi:HSP20 family protein
MAITRWDPFREVVALQNRVNSLFRDINEGEEPADHGQLCAGGRHL